MIRLGQASVSLELREVFKGGHAVRVGARAFDILEVLIDSQGRLVSKDELLKRVWPDTVVEENNLQVHICFLRKVLGCGRDMIKTIPGRGYRLVVAAASAASSASVVDLPEVVGMAATAISQQPNLRLIPVASHNRIAAMDIPITEEQGIAQEGLVYIVDDEDSVRVAVDRLLRSAGFTSKSFCSAEAFLKEPAVDRPSCLLLDINMATFSGFDLQLELGNRGNPMPIIFMTGFGTIPLSVKAMKAGAHEFLTKPFEDEALLEAIRNALIKDKKSLGLRRIYSQLHARFETLTPREREVLPLLIDGKKNKQVAYELGTREITSKVHKKHIMTKMQATSLLELARMCEILGGVSQLEKPNNS